MRKTYEASNQEEFEAIIMKIIIRKVRKMVGNKPIRITVKGDGDD